MDIIAKILGLAAIFVGLLVWYVDYIIFHAIGALGTSFAATIGFTGTAILGIQIIGWIAILGLLSTLFILGIVAFYIGLKILTE